MPLTPRQRLSIFKIKPTFKRNDRTNLPNVCVKCKKFKTADAGKYVKCKEDYGRTVWMCYHCLNTPTISRLKRNPSPLEIVICGLLKKKGYSFIQEFVINKFQYDFAVPKLMVLVELDSKLYHSSPQRKAKDRVKNIKAKQHGWDVLRIKAGGNVSLALERALLKREAELMVDKYLS